MKLTWTKDTLIAFTTVAVLAGTALGLANKTAAMISPVAMAKLGIHRMPNGDWMQVTEAAAGRSEPTGHNVPNDGAALPERRKQQQPQPGEAHHE